MWCGDDDLEQILLILLTRTDIITTAANSERESERIGNENIRIRIS